ncbi:TRANSMEMBRANE PROTEIN [Salix purpurea]|uniref:TRANSMEMBRANE PROTEIN n=1 Tax=Salix purpurea TaxID=77065 RepID=A0A9Q0V2H5_SALPP|nr:TRANSMEMBRANE PROTEIN [Salix purpurea]
MDFSNFDTVKAEKVDAMLKYNSLQAFTKVFRLLEFCLAFVLFLWIFNKLPFAVKIFGEFFRRLAGIIASPLFVFLLSNGIIATLIAKSGRFSGEYHGADNAETQLYEELIKNTDSNRNCPKPFLTENPNLLLSHAATATATTTEMETTSKEEGVVFQEKHVIISGEKASTRTRENGDEDHAPDAEIYSDSDSDCKNIKIRRTKSEKMERKNYVKEKKQLLRRSETELGSGEENLLCRENELSDEEFQRAIDEFIARHLMFRRKESMSVVVQNQITNIAEIEKQC